MDAYEATKVVFSRIQVLEPEHAAKIMGLLLVQDHGEKEMIRLAFGPDSLLHSLVLKARSDLGLAGPWASSAPLLLRQAGPQPPLPSWAPPPNDVYTEFLDAPPLSPQSLYHQDDMWGEAVSGGGAHHRRSYSLSEAEAAAAMAWKPCLYFARGYCKNGATCRFVHGFPENDAAAAAAEHELFLRTKSSPRPLMASAFPYSPTSSSPKNFNFLLQNENNQRAAVAAAAMMLSNGDEAKYMMRSPRMQRSEVIASLNNPGARQIYLTFPADSTFSEEDVSNYFSMFGPVQDVRIPYQQKRMFGFVTFVYSETVKLILAKGNPHFVCDARVLVKPYKEKGKVPDKFRNKQLQAERGEFSACSSPTGLLDCRDPFEMPQLGARMLYGNVSTGQEALLRRKLEEQQSAELQQAIEQQGRRFMGLQLLDLKARAHQPNNSMNSVAAISASSASDGKKNGIGIAIAGSNLEESTSQGVSAAVSASVSAAVTAEPNGTLQKTVNCLEAKESGSEAAPNVDFGFQESGLEHNLPDSPFASPTKVSMIGGSSCFSSSFETAAHSNNTSHLMASSLFHPTSTLDMASYNSCFFQVPRFSSAGHGAIGM